MSTRIFMCLSTKLASLHHVDESWLEFKSIVSDIGRRSSTDIDRSWSRELTEGLVSHGFKKLVLSSALYGCPSNLKLELS